MGAINRILRWGWRGIEVWDVLLALGVTPVLRASFINIIGGWEWYEQLLLFGGVFLIILSILIIISPFIKQQVENRRQTKQAKVQEDIEQDIVYFPSREYWPEIHVEWANISEAWMFCHTGAHIRVNYDFHKNGKIRRLLLIDPKLNYKPPFLAQCRVVNRTPEDVEQDVRRLSKEAHIAKAESGQPLGIAVKWLDKPLQNIDFYLIANPNTESSWIRAEMFMANRRAREWPSYRIEKKKHELLYQVLLERYEQLWGLAKEPDWGLI